MNADPKLVARAIAERIRPMQTKLAAAWRASGPVQHFIVDDLLEPDLVRRIAAGYPDPRTMMRRSSLRERKRVGIAVEAYSAEVRNALFAFQDEEVIELVRAITDLSGAIADPSLYASGLSVMGRGDFLNPHIDNSHDGEGRNYRVLNLLFYVSEDWTSNSGGHLELWDPRVRTQQVVESRFNRLVVMATHPTSWHSVSKVRVDGARRCVSNYYFSPQPPGGVAYRNVTTFTGRPEQVLRRAVLDVTDGVVLNAVGRMLPFLLRRSKHRRTGAQPVA